jgi:hypothetical protein
MKKLVFVAAAAVVSFPAFAQTGGTVLTNPEFGNGFTNRGQCQSTLAHVRNEQRRNPATRGADYRQLSPSDFQRESLRTTRCEERNGRYVVVFYRNGF